MLAATESSSLDIPTQVFQPWHVLRVMTGHEAELEVLLEHAHIESAVIKWKVPRRPRWGTPDRKTEMVDRPIFPGYVLIRCIYEAGGSVLREFPFVIEFLRFGSKFAQVQQVELDCVNQLLDSGLHILARHRLTRGQKVRVKYGPLLGVIGEFIKEKNADIFVVNVDMLGRSLATRMAWDQVEPIKDTTAVA